MRHLTLPLLLSLTPAAVVAQDVQYGLFDTYDAYESAILGPLMAGEALDAVSTLTDLRLIPIAQRAEWEQQIKGSWPSPFPNTAIIRDDALGEFSREIRAFWTDNGQYRYFYTYLHRLPGDQVRVVHFGLSTSITDVFQLF